MVDNVSSRSLKALLFHKSFFIIIKTKWKSNTLSSSFTSGAITCLKYQLAKASDYRARKVTRMNSKQSRKSYLRTTKTLYYSKYSRNGWSTLCVLTTASRQRGPRLPRSLPGSKIPDPDRFRSQTCCCGTDCLLFSEGKSREKVKDDLFGSVSRNGMKPTQQQLELNCLTSLHWQTLVIKMQY